MERPFNDSMIIEIDVRDVIDVKDVLGIIESEATSCAETEKWEVVSKGVLLVKFFGESIKEEVRFLLGWWELTLEAFEVEKDWSEVKNHRTY